MTTTTNPEALNNAAVTANGTINQKILKLTSDKGWVYISIVLSVTGFLIWAGIYHFLD